MARPLRIHIPGAIYHVMSRGNGGQKIFLDDRDYQRFLALYSRVTARFAVRCHAYCLMPNHFHLIVEPRGHPLARAMQQMNSAYSQLFNRRHTRVGHVLQGRYKGILVDRDEYFVQLIRYVLQNPVRAGLVKAAADWPWSSYQATAGVRKAPDFLYLRDVLKAFGEDRGRAARKRFVDFTNTTADLPTALALAFGSDAFAARIGNVIGSRRYDREFVRTERLVGRPPLQQLLADSGRGARRARRVRAAFGRHGYTLCEIAGALGLHPSTVCKLVRRVVKNPRPHGRRKKGVRS